ncbi:hypothetical protein LAZ67_7002059 [Cordylochernes scorpioides]|uniref:Peptidase aspartic putative domain-containing protein n=1 Tax=Cordylochernes scorpioides TaxID=51811 RepID=A0ABY6KMR6_9ARAC|nr:hypothetical protein LAZ67_7002059 [Cordylochernes scorpioides]
MGKNFKSIDHVRCGPPPRFPRMCGTSLKTINNIIHKDLELDTRRKGKVHKLTPFHMKNRATNARKLYEEHLAGSRSEYTATLDEAWMYVTYCNGIRKICYIKRGNQVPDNWVHQCSETFPKGFMVVGVMTGRGVLPLIKVPSKVKVNSEFYIECVLKPVIEQLKDLYPGEMDKVFLHHDKASSHTSNKTQQFLQEMKDTLGLNFIRNSDIPVKSPDASPLDFYGFGMLKQRLFNRRPKTEAGLWKAAQEEWSNVSLSKVKEMLLVIGILKSEVMEGGLLKMVIMPDFSKFAGYCNCGICVWFEIPGPYFRVEVYPNLVSAPMIAAVTTLVARILERKIQVDQISAEPWTVPAFSLIWVEDSNCQGVRILMNLPFYSKQHPIFLYKSPFQGFPPENIPTLAFLVVKEGITEESIDREWQECDKYEEEKFDIQQKVSVLRNPDKEETIPIASEDPVINVKLPELALKNYDGSLEGRENLKENATEPIASLSSQACTGQVLLMTTVALLRGPNASRRVRILLDSGSQFSYIKQSLVWSIGIERKGEITIAKSLFGGNKIGEEKHGKFMLELENLGNKRDVIHIEALDQRKICDAIPPFPKGDWLEKLKIKGIILSQDNFKGQEIDILIGANYLGMILTGKIVQVEADLTAVETKLGWTLMGNSPIIDSNDNVQQTLNLLTTRCDLKDLWDLEVLGIRDPVETCSKETRYQEIKEKFITKIQRQSDQRYSVGLPWKVEKESIPSNLDIAIKRFIYLKVQVFGDIVLEKVFSGLFDIQGESLEDHALDFKALVNEAFRKSLAGQTHQVVTIHPDLVHFVSSLIVKMLLYHLISINKLKLDYVPGPSDHFIYRLKVEVRRKFRAVLYVDALLLGGGRLPRPGFRDVCPRGLLFLHPQCPSCRRSLLPSSSGFLALLDCTAAMPDAPGPRRLFLLCTRVKPSPISGSSSSNKSAQVFWTCTEPIEGVLVELSFDVAKFE